MNEPTTPHLTKIAVSDMSPDDRTCLDRMILDKLSKLFSENSRESNQAIEQTGSEGKHIAINDVDKNRLVEIIQDNNGLRLFGQPAWMNRDSPFPSIRSLANLEAMECLQSLNIEGNLIKDIGPLATLPQLRWLNMAGNQIEDIAPLRHCQKLYSLDLKNNPITDLSPLVEIASLRALYIEAEQVDLLKGLHLPQVKILMVKGEVPISSLNFLTSVPELRQLYLEGEIQQIDGLDHLKEMLTVNIRGITQVPDQWPASKTCVWIALESSSFEGSIDLAAFSDLENLESLEIRNIPVENWRGLEALPNLFEAYFAGMLRGAKDDAEYQSFQMLLDERKPKLTQNPIRSLRASTKIDVVSESEFNNYDSINRFGAEGDWDFNVHRMHSERSLLCNSMEEYFKPYEGKGDYGKPDLSAVAVAWDQTGGFSTTLVLYNSILIPVFPEIVRGLQDILSRMPSEWILYFQSDSMEDGFPEFNSWLYADKIQVTKKYSQTIEELLKV